MSKPVCDFYYIKAVFLSYLIIRVLCDVIIPYTLHVHDLVVAGILTSVCSYPCYRCPLIRCGRRVNPKMSMAANKARFSSYMQWLRFCLQVQHQICLLNVKYPPMYMMHRVYFLHLNHHNLLHG